MKRKVLTLLVTILILTFMTTTANATSASVNDITAYRGDTVTFSATLSGSETVGMGGVSVSYDSSVLELISGTCEVGGAMLTNFDAATGMGAFMFSGTGSVSGTLFTATFKVKDTASFGTTTVSMDITLKDASNADISVSNSSGSITIACNHSFTKEDTTYLKSEATCTSPAIYYKSCVTCGEKGTATFEYGSTKAHSYTKQVTTDTYKKSSATCTAKAVYYHCCATCNAKGTTTYEYGTTLSHNYTRKVVTDTYKKSAATCTEAAVYYYCCATCDAKGTTTYTNGSKLGHTGGTATCTAKAECTRCHQAYGNMLEHVYTAQDATATYLKSEATCTSKAIYYKNCATCDKAGTVTFEYGSTKAHSYTKQVTTDAYKKSSATCTAKAVYYYCCATCTKAGTTTFEHGTTLSHAYTRKVTTDTYKKSSATCTEAAVYYYCCATCDAKGTTTYTNGNKLGHTGGTATCTAKAECTRCHQAYGNMLEHTYNQEVAQEKYLASAASCTAKAKYYRSCSCGEKGTVTFEYGEKKAHTNIQKVDDLYLKSKATCTAKAVYYESCSVCGEKGTATFETGNAPGHNYNTSWSSDVSAHWHECSKCGDKKDYDSHIAGASATENTAQTCTVCGYIITPALGHTHHYSTAWSKDAENHWYACSGCSEQKDKSAHSYKNACDTDCNVCGYVRTITHSYNTEWSKNAEKHWYECSVCGNKKNETAHTPGADATETIDQTCTVCGYVIKEALGHTHNYNTMKNDETNHWNECACGEKSGMAVHTWDDGIITKEATYDAEGEKTYTCSVCAHTKTDVIDKLVKDDVTNNDDNIGDSNDNNTDNEPTLDVPADGDDDTDGGHKVKGNTTIVIMVVAGTVVAIVAVGVVVILFKKRKH